MCSVWLYKLRTHPAIPSGPRKVLYYPAAYCSLQEFNVSLSSASRFTSSMAVSRDTWNSFLGARHECLESQLEYQAISTTPLPICIYDANKDKRFSGQIHTTGKWISDNDVKLMQKLGLCQQDRRVFIDVGAGVGAVSILAGAQGCQIVAFEPQTGNVGRLLRNLKDSKVQKHATVYRNAVTGTRDLMYVHQVETDPLGATVNHSAAGSWDQQVFSVWIDDFFAYAGRPESMGRAKLISPNDVAMIWIDVNGHELAAAYSMNLVLQIGRVPIVHITFYSALWSLEPTCDIAAFLQHMTRIGYSAFVNGKKVTVQNLKVMLESASEARVPVDVWYLDAVSQQLAA
jgi:FkbM family methyltransferase